MIAVLVQLVIAAGWVHSPSELVHHLCHLLDWNAGPPDLDCPLVHHPWLAVWFQLADASLDSETVLDAVHLHTGVVQHLVDQSYPQGVPLCVWLVDVEQDGVSLKAGG